VRVYHHQQRRRESGCIFKATNQPTIPALQLTVAQGSHNCRVKPKLSILAQSKENLGKINAFFCNFNFNIFINVTTV
jgi:hypothetical protein